MQDNTIYIHGFATQLNGLNQPMVSVTREVQFDKDHPVESFVKLFYMLRMVTTLNQSVDGMFYTRSKTVVGTFNTKGLSSISAKVEYGNDLFDVLMVSIGPSEFVVVICSEAYSRLVYSVTEMDEWIQLECRDAYIDIPDKFKYMIVEI